MFSKEEAIFLLDAVDQARVNTTIGGVRKGLDLQPEIKVVISKLEELTKAPEAVEAEVVD